MRTTFISCVCTITNQHRADINLHVAGNNEARSLLDDCKELILSPFEPAIIHCSLREKHHHRSPETFSLISELRNQASLLFKNTVAAITRQSSCIEFSSSAILGKSPTSTPLSFLIANPTLDDIPAVPVIKEFGCVKVQVSKFSQVFRHCIFSIVG